MNIRTFVKGGYRDLTGPTTVISGQTAVFIATPIDAAPRPAHPEPEGAVSGADREGHAGGATPQGARLPADERTEAPSHGGAAPHAGRGGVVRPRKAPARLSIAQTLDRANKEGRS